MESSTGEEIREQEQEASPCFICHQLIKFNDTHNNNNNGDFHRLGKNLEVCQKFCTLAGRFLNFSCDESNDNNFNQRKTLNIKSDKCTFDMEQQICDDCFNWAQIFCELYGNWRQLKLWLIHTVQEMATLMKKKNTKKNNDFKAKLDGEFRAKFLLHVEKGFSKGKDYPKLKLKRLPTPTSNNLGVEDDDDGDDLFTPIVAKKKRKFKKPIGKPPKTICPKDSTVASTKPNDNDPTIFSESGNSDTETISNSNDTIAVTATEKIDQSSNKTRPRPPRYPVRTVVPRPKETATYPPTFKSTKPKFSPTYTKLKNKVRDNNSNKGKINKFINDDNIDNDGDCRLSCKFCGKKFSLSYNRRIHERIHTNQRPFSCPICPHTSKQLGHLQKHLLVTHRLDANKVKELTTRNSSKSGQKKFTNKTPETRVKQKIKIKPSEDENLEQTENENEVNECRAIDLYTGNANGEHFMSDLVGDVNYPVDGNLLPDNHENEVPHDVGLVFGGKVEIVCDNAEADEHDDEARRINPNANFILPCIDTNFDGYAEEEMEVD